MLCCACKTKYGTKVRIVGLLFKLIMSVEREVAGSLNVRNVFFWFQICKFCCGWSDMFLLQNAFVSCALRWKGLDIFQFEKIDMLCQSFLRLEEVSEEQKVEIVLLVGRKKFFGIGEMVDNSRFTSLQKWLRVTFYVKRFVENLKVILGNAGKVCVGKISAEKIPSRHLPVQDQQWKQ